MTSFALARAIAATFADATTEIPADPPIDVARARAQHAAYVDGLRAMGLEVVVLPADDRFPDGCFVEDCALLVSGVALVTRPGAASRRGEVDAIAAALQAHPSVERVVHMEAPATLDGGDCLRVGSRIFVGLSARTNAEGVAQVRAVFEPRGLTVVAVPLQGLQVLHLKCVCSPLDDRRVLLAEGTLAPDTFDSIEVITVPRAEAYAANCVVHRGQALVAQGFPATRALLERAGLSTHVLDTSEFRKADGALTCLSILI